MRASAFRPVSILLVLMAVLLIGLQYKLWRGNGNVLDVLELEDAVEAQRQRNETLRERNRALEAEVRDLKTGLEAVEERARLELGMIKEGETFFQVVEPKVAENESQ